MGEGDPGTNPGVCPRRGLPGQKLPWTEIPSPDGRERAVRILLECILVFTKIGMSPRFPSDPYIHMPLSKHKHPDPENSTPFIG